MGKYNDLSDLEVMKKVRKYDSRALEELYDRYSPLLFTLIKKIAPDEKTAEEILVDVFAILWKRPDAFDFETGNVYVWMVQLARNKAVDTLRRSRMATEELENYTDEYEEFYILPVLDKGMDNLDYATAIALQPKMEKALSKLTDAQRYVIGLAWYEGYTINQISGQLNIPVETVRNKVMTALNNLKENLLAES